MREALIIIAAVFAMALIVTIIGIVVGGRFALTGANAGILKTDDGGFTWRLLGDTVKMEISSIKLDKNDSSKIYAGTRRNGILLGSNNGEEWRQLAETNSRIFDIVEVDEERNILLAAVFSNDRGRVVRITDDVSQELYFTPLAKYAIFGVRVGIGDPRVIRAISSDGGFYESVDNGNSWKAVYRFDEGLLQLVDDPGNAGRYWAVTSRGNVYGTSDAGRSWQNLSSGYAKFSGADKIETLIFDKKMDALYIGSKYGLLRSYDGGRNWHEVALSIPPEILPITAVAVDLDRAGTIYAAAKNQLYTSNDNGETWHGTVLPTKRTASIIVVDPKNSDNVYIGLRN